MRNIHTKTSIINLIVHLRIFSSPLPILENKTERNESRNKNHRQRTFSNQLHSYVDAGPLKRGPRGSFPSAKVHFPSITEEPGSRGGKTTLTPTTAHLQPPTRPRPGRLLSRLALALSRQRLSNCFT